MITYSRSGSLEIVMTAWLAHSGEIHPVWNKPFFNFQNIAQWKAVEMAIEKKAENKCLPRIE